MVRAWLTFHPKQKNPARRSGLGVWRVKECRHTSVAHPPIKIGSELAVLTDRAYKRGSRVDPKALALRGLHAVLRGAV